MQKLLPTILCAAMSLYTTSAEPAETTVNIARVSTDSSYATCFLIQSPAGINVVMDPYYVDKDVTADVVTITHPHPDHTDQRFQQEMAARGIPVFINRRLSWQKGDVRITGIPAMHNPVQLTPDDPSNTIYVVETGGLRIAHFGDLGQTAFSDEQLDALGRIDVAFMQFDNSYSDLRATEGRAFRLMSRIHPSLIIPTHAGGDSLALLKKTYGKIRQVKKTLSIAPDTLPPIPQVVGLQIAEK